MTTDEAPRHKRSRRKAKIMYHTLVLLGVGCLFSLIAVLVKPFDSVNLWLSDQLFTSESPSSNIVIIGIDDETLSIYGKWSEWPRRLHAQAINNLSQAGAKVIGYDVLFVDNSADDQILAAAIANTGNVVLAAAGTEPLPSVEYKLTYSSFLLPAVPLELASNSIGHAMFEPDHDGKVRRLPLVIRDAPGNICPSFSLAVLYTHFSMPLPEAYPVQDYKLHLLARDVPVDSYSRLKINFVTDYENQAYISYGDIISDNFDHSLVKNKIVLIGMMATGEFDAWSVPVSVGKMPGVLIHAAAIDTILRQRFLTEAGTGTTVLILLLIVGITALALPRLKLRWGTILLAGLFVGYLGITFLSFDRGNILNMFYPLSLLPTIFVSCVVYLIVREQSDKQFVSDLFGRYVSPQVAREIINSADAGQLRLGGETRDVTVLFADIRNYTVMSERMPPEAIVDMLNIHLSIIIDKVLQNNGMVNKFAGDNIMAVWNAPEPQPEHARLAVKASREAQQALAGLPQSDPSLPKVQFGIGLNSGKVLAGNVGSVGRAEYTVIGDTVNLASRICSGTPGGEVFIGPETYRQAKDHLEVEKLAPQTFKGKAEQVTVYRVTGYK
ncbi:MAG: adenylate/guanylate cyclase domain-containing protein [Dehalococcoidales bacterium]|nr:adenylate/guanylate cyclase domain-containing protein [Dehalococcoidales bacterium]